jgi:hypothetical protein
MDTTAFLVIGLIVNLILSFFVADAAQKRVLASVESGMNNHRRPS